MIAIGKSKVRNRAIEMTLKEWGQVREMIGRVQDGADNFGAIDAWFEIFELMGASVEDCEDLTGAELLLKTKEFNSDKIPKKFIRTLVLEGREFEAYAEGRSFVMNGKKMGLLERYIKAYDVITFPEMMAGIFKEVGVTKEVHEDLENMRERAVLFESMKANIAVPYLAELGVEIAEIIRVKEENGITEKLG